MMGGELQVQSTEHVGSTFWFQLDLPTVDERQVLYAPEGQRVIGFSQQARPENEVFSKILVVDDKLENRALLTSLLLSLGFEVQEAENGQEGERRRWNFGRI
jgi:hypothetical protein